MMRGSSVIVDLTSVNRVDLSGLHMLSSLEDKLKAEDIALALVGAKGAVQDTFQRWIAVSQHSLLYSTIRSARRCRLGSTTRRSTSQLTARSRQSTCG